ncbi:MAG: 5'-nucleotidase C-terminal domain-containing protein, partial [Ardenticatenaceae bacterium]
EVSLNVSRASVRGSESNAGNMIADSFLYMYEQYSNTNGMEPVIALQNGGGIRQNAGDVLSGTISQRNTMDVLPFSNLLSVVQSVTPTDTKGILEHSADRLPDLGGQFLQVAGFTVTYSLQNDVGSRVVSVELKDGTKIIENGAIVNGAPSVTVITNSFVARGGDGYSQFGDNPNQSTLRDDSGTFIFYERAWREYLQTLPVSGNPALPTVLASDPRYQPGGEGRITIIPADVTAIDLAELNSSGTSVPVWPLAVGMMLISLGLLSIARRRTL